MGPRSRGLSNSAESKVSGRKDDMDLVYVIVSGAPGDVPELLDSSVFYTEGELELAQAHAKVIEGARVLPLERGTVKTRETIIRDIALSKLTQEEKRILGLNTK